MASKAPDRPDPDCAGLGLYMKLPVRCRPTEAQLLIKMTPSLRYKKRYERSFHTSAITSVAFNSYGSLFAASSLDGLVSVWEVNTGSVLHRINARTPVHSLVWSSQSEGFIFGCANGILVSVFMGQVFFFLCRHNSCY